MPGAEKQGQEVPPSLAGSLAFLLRCAELDLADRRRPILATMDLDDRQLTVLAAAVDEGSQPQRRLAEALRIDRTTMVAIVDELERKGLVGRRRHPDDRRAYTIISTARGRDCLEKAMRAAGAVEREYESPLSGADGEALRANLRRLVDRG